MVRCLDLVKEFRESSAEDQLGTLKRNGRNYKAYTGALQRFRRMWQCDHMFVGEGVVYFRTFF